MLSVEERFWSKVQKTGDCWLWNAAIRSKDCGYGAFRFQRQGRWTQASAHRVAWELTHGAIPEGQCVLHRCDNKRCCNPAHLFLGTNSDNTQDMLAKGRHNAARGSDSGPAKLCEDDIRYIRFLCGTGQKQDQIGRRFGVSQQTISRIHRRLDWRHVA
jgi:hypothetical protein